MGHPLAARLTAVDLLALRYFQAVARREHISRAAEDLRVAQPSVSRTIARLEADLGVPLFDRQGRSIRLNRYGAAFLRRVENALAELDDARREITDAAGLDGGRLALATETLLPLSELLATYRTRHPAVAVHAVQATSETMLGQLRERAVDFCVASQPLTAPGLTTLPLLHEDVLLAVPDGHPFAERPSVTVSDLVGEPFITTRPGNWQRALLERLFAQTGRRPVLSCEGDEPGATHFLVEAGLGVALLPELSRHSIAHCRVTLVPVDAPDCHRTLSLVRREDGYLSSAAARFRELAVAHFADFARRGQPER